MSPDHQTYVSKWIVALARAIESRSAGKNSSPFCRIPALLPSRITALVMPAIEGSASSKESRSGTRTWNSRSRRLFHSIVPSRTMPRIMAAKSHRGISITRFSNLLALSTSPQPQGVRSMQLDQHGPMIGRTRADHAIGAGGPSRIGEDVVDALPHVAVRAGRVVAAQAEQLGRQQRADLGSSRRRVEVSHQHERRAGLLEPLDEAGDLHAPRSPAPAAPGGEVGDVEVDLGLGEADARMEERPLLPLPRQDVDLGRAHLAARE